MKNDNFFKKSILCALVLFCFSSATAMFPGEHKSKIVVVGNSSKKGEIIEKMVDPFLLRRLEYRGTTVAPPCEETTFHFGNCRTIPVMIWNAPSQKESMWSYLHGADAAFLVTSSVNETDDKVNEELNYYFDEIMRYAAIDKRMVIVLIEDENWVRLNFDEMEKRFGAINKWCERKDLACVYVSASGIDGISEACSMIADRLSEDRSKLGQRINPDPEDQGRRCSI
jgi:hypothetical protein